MPPPQPHDIGELGGVPIVATHDPLGFLTGAGHVSVNQRPSGMSLPDTTPWANNAAQFAHLIRQLPVRDDREQQPGQPSHPLRSAATISTHEASASHPAR